MKPNLKSILNLLFLLFTFGVVLVIGLNGNDMDQLLMALNSLTPVYLILCVLCWMLFVLTDALAVFFFVRQLGYRLNFRQSVHGAMTGIFYCNVTPSASGGQPLEMYCLSQYGVPIGVSGSALALKYAIDQFMLVVLGAVLWLTHSSFVAEHTQGTIWFIELGFAVNIFSVAMVMMMAVNQRAVMAIIRLCVRIGTKLRICKKPEATLAKWENHSQTFLYGVRKILKHPSDVLVQCLIALAQLFALMSVIVMIYHAMGLSGVSDTELFTMSTLLHLGASYTPLPGASGAQEGGFAVVYSGIFPEAKLFIALMLWRFSSYYLSVFAGAAMIAVENARKLRKSAVKKKEGQFNERSDTDK